MDLKATTQQKNFEALENDLICEALDDDLRLWRAFAFVVHDEKVDGEPSLQATHAATLVGRKRCII
jgi:hypothetical protein